MALGSRVEKGCSAGAILAAAAAILLTPGGGSARLAASPPSGGAVALEREWKRELFHAAAIRLLDGYQPGDVTVVAGALDAGAPDAGAGTLRFFGHEGVLSVPVEAPGVEPGSLLRGRFRLSNRGGGTTLRLVTSLSTMSTQHLRQRASADFASLVPRLETLLASGRETPRLAAEPAAAFQVVPPPEGWQVLYVITREHLSPREIDVALRYEQTSPGVYRLTRCWAAAVSPRG